MGQILALDSQSNQKIMEEINLFDLIPDESRVTLNEEQKRLIAVVKNRPTTAELHFANLINDPENLLKEGKALRLPLPDQKLVVAVGERTAVNRLGYLSWIGEGMSPRDTATVGLSPEGEVGGTLSVEGSIYQSGRLGGGLRAIILIDFGTFLPDHAPEFGPAAF